MFLKCGRQRGVLSLLPALSPQAFDASPSWGPDKKAGFRKQLPRAEHKARRHGIRGRDGFRAYTDGELPKIQEQYTYGAKIK